MAGNSGESAQRKRKTKLRDEVSSFLLTVPVHTKFASSEAKLTLY
jgi:hypothetical protein